MTSRVLILAMERCHRERDAVVSSLEHADWRVRYAAAVAAGLWRDPAHIEALSALLEREDREPLYTQPAVRYEGDGEPLPPGYDDATALAEYVGPIRVIFPRPPTDGEREAWRRRGRVKQAALFAIAAIGQAPPALVARIAGYVTSKEEDAVVQAAATRCLGALGARGHLDVLRAAAASEDWCVSTEAARGLRSLGG